MIWTWVGEEYMEAVLLPGAYKEVMAEALEGWLQSVQLIRNEVKV